MATVDAMFRSMATMASVWTSPFSNAASLAETVVSPRSMPQDTLTLSARRALEKPGASLRTYPGGFSSATTIKAASSPRELLNGLFSDWSNWWMPGKISNFRATAEGGTAFNFSPMAIAGIGPMSVDVELKAPRFSKTATGHDVIRVPLKLSRDLEGHGYFEARALPEGGSLLQAVWEDARIGGLKQYVPGMPEMLGRAHLGVEDIYLKCLDTFSKNLTHFIR